jgi:serine/threonine protein kinase
MQSLTPGTRLGRFKLGTLLGRGGMGEVWKAQDVRLGREVAIKILPPELAAHPELQIRFDRESKILAALNHPGIAQIYEADEEYPEAPDQTKSPTKIMFLVMEFVEGKSLSEILANGALPILTSIRLGRQIAKALYAAHEAGIIHRDLKPANIMVSSRNQVKVLDFGLARPLAQHIHSTGQALPEVTTSGMVMGTAAYLAPEQIKGQAADIQSDIWSLGCVLYQMLVGRRPFPADSIPEVLASVLRDEPIDVSTLNSSVNAPLKTLVDKCLSKDPEKRPKDAKEVSALLKEILHELRHGQPSSPSMEPVPVSIAAVSPSIEMINRYLRMINSGFPQISAKDGKVGVIELEHRATKMGILVVPKPSGDKIAIVVPICRLPEGDAQRIYAKLLALNNGHTDIARFSFDKETRTINLTCIRNCSSIDSRQLRHILDSLSTVSQRIGGPLMTEFGMKKD